MVYQQYWKYCNFSLFTRHVSFQIFLLIGHFTNLTRHNYLLTENTSRKISQGLLVSCSVIVCDNNMKLAGHFQNLVGQYPMTACYFQHCIIILTNKFCSHLIILSHFANFTELKKGVHMVRMCVKNCLQRK